jgi:hypothetical protein
MQVIVRAMCGRSSAVERPGPIREVAGSTPVSNVPLFKPCPSKNAESECGVELAIPFALRAIAFSTGRRIGLSFINAGSPVRVRSSAPDAEVAQW